MDTSIRNAIQWKALLGFFKESDAHTYITSQGLQLPKETEDALKLRVKEAIAHVQGINGRRNVRPDIKEIPESHKAHLEQVSQRPSFQEITQGADSWSFGMVEIRKTHCFQTNVNLDYSGLLAEKAPSPDDLQGTLEFCLPTKEVQASEFMLGFNQATWTYSLVSENLDLRLVGNVQGEDPNSKRKFVGFMFGGGVRQISVVEYQGVYMIKNGYHRAYALAKKGHEYMPCIVVKTDSWQFTGANAAGFFPVDLMTSDKSPIVGDFFSKAAVDVPRRRMRVILTVHGEAQVLPT